MSTEKKKRGIRLSDSTLLKVVDEVAAKLHNTLRTRKTKLKNLLFLTRFYAQVIILLSLIIFVIYFINWRL